MSLAQQRERAIDNTMNAIGGLVRSGEKIENIGTHEFHAKIIALARENLVKLEPYKADAESIWSLVEGKRGRMGIRATKPQNGKAAYVWRLLRFHLGIDNHIPILCEWYLDDQLEMDGDLEKRDRDLEYESPQYQAYLEKRKGLRKHWGGVVEYLLNNKFPVQQYQQAFRWKGALF